jgi:hypothetical protein
MGEARPAEPQGPANRFENSGIAEERRWQRFRSVGSRTNFYSGFRH